jgi:DHA1 family multidrug resistance protein-like MFS transporter
MPLFGPHSDIYHKAERLRKADPVKNKDLRAEGEVNFSPAVLLEQTILRPFKMLVQEPILVLVTIYLSIVYSVLYGRKSRIPRFVAYVV